jgi:hypothetical protein
MSLQVMASLRLMQSVQQCTLTALAKFFPGSEGHPCIYSPLGAAFACTVLLVFSEISPFFIEQRPYCDVKLISDYCAAHCIFSTYGRVFFSHYCESPNLDSLTWPEPLSNSLFSVSFQPKGFIFSTLILATTLILETRLNNPLHTVAPRFLVKEMPQNSSTWQRHVHNLAPAGLVECKLWLCC